MADLNALQQKYHAAIDFIQKQGGSIKNVHIENDKLLIRAALPNENVKNQVWDQIKAIDPNFSDLNVDFPIDSSLKVPEQIYEVKPGDSLSKIAKHFYGNANDYMKIFHANQDQLSDPDQIQVGQQLRIPQ